MELHRGFMKEGYSKKNTLLRSYFERFVLPCTVRFFGCQVDSRYTITPARIAITIPALMMIGIQ
jgi:hypothetical protein